jgi:hypothetical protein
MTVDLSNNKNLKFFLSTHLLFYTKHCAKHLQMKKERAASAYSLFMKENYSTIKKKNSKLANPELLKKIAVLYKKSQAKKARNSTSSSSSDTKLSVLGGDSI